MIPLNKFNWFSVQNDVEPQEKQVVSWRSLLGEPEGEHSFKGAQDQKEVNLGDIKIYEIL